MPDEQKTVATPSELYKAMLPDMTLVDALDGGTRTMRAAGQAYLPQEPGETVAAYKLRLDRTFLFPGFQRSLQAMVGMVFAAPLKMADKLPEDVDEWTKDIDLTGRSLDSFAREAFEIAMKKGLVHIHADFPRVENADGLTVADERAMGNRPYLRIVDPSSVIWWWTEVEGGVERLKEVRILELVRERDGAYGEKFIEQIRILRPGEYEVHRKKGGDEKEETWILVEEGEVSYPDEIPWTTIYTGRTGPMQAEPPMLELANLNISHWQSSSDQRNILRIARVPFLFGAGVEAEDVSGSPTGEGSPAKFSLGANRMITSENPEAKLGFVEHTGKAISAGRQDLEDLKAEMAAVALQLLVQRPGNETATARSIDKAEMDSSLKAWAIELGTGFSMALSQMLKWKNIDDDLEGAVTANYDFGLTAADRESLDALLKARAQGDISRETFWAELKRRAFLDEAFDPVIEVARLASEMPAPGNPDDDLDDDDGGGTDED